MVDSNQAVRPWFRSLRRVLTRILSPAARVNNSPCKVSPTDPLAPKVFLQSRVERGKLNNENRETTSVRVRSTKIVKWENQNIKQKAVRLDGRRTWFWDARKSRSDKSEYTMRRRIKQGLSKVGIRKVFERKANACIHCQTMWPRKKKAPRDENQMDNFTTSLGKK